MKAYKIKKAKSTAIVAVTYRMQWDFADCGTAASKASVIENLEWKKAPYCLVMDENIKIQNLLIRNILIKKRRITVHMTTNFLNSSNLLVLAANNPYNTNDTDAGLYSLAMSINANGLINPLLVNRFSDAEYRIISGERRYLAITRFLHWDTIPCMVYDHLSKNTEQLKLHTANLAVREYTAWQKLQFYVDTERLLSNMQKSGENTGPVQKGIAELLGISTHQIRKYKRIAEESSETQLNNLRTGKISIEKAYQITRNKFKTGRASAENGEPDADVPLSDPTNYMDAVRMLKSLPVKSG